MSDLALELVETYMEELKNADEMDLLKDLENHPYFWNGGNLEPEEDNKSYEEWLDHFGVNDDDKEE
jgi:hypothetical protein